MQELKLNETPYIKIRKNGQIDYTAAHITTAFNNEFINGVTFSYNTVIGIFINFYGNKLYLETAGSYSTTTAGKHKPRAASIAIHNNYKILDNIKPDALKNIAYYSDPDDIEKTIKEHAAREDLKKFLKICKSKDCIKERESFYNNTSFIKENKTHYKNGNIKTERYYKSNFKNVLNLEFKFKKHIFKKVTYKDGKKLKYNSIKERIIITGGL